MKRCYPLLLAALCSPFFTLAQWESQNLNLPTPTLVSNVDMVNANVAWAGGWTGDFASPAWSYTNPDNQFSRTIDGQNWTSGTFPSSGAGYFAHIAAVDANVAFVAYVDPGAGQKVFKTIDGGQTWTDTNAGLTVFIDVVHAFNGTNAVAIGDPDALGYEIFTTNNGGDSWQRVDPSALPPFPSGEFAIASIFSTDGNHIWFATNYGRVYHSSNQGYTWDAWPAPPSPDETNHFPDYITCKAGGACLMTFSDYTDQVTGNWKGYIYRTKDDGTTWEDITPADNNYAFAGIYYIPGGALIASARGNNLTGPFKTLVSYDDGDSWTTIDEGTRTYRFNFVDPNTGYATEYENDGSPTEIYRYTGDPILGLFDTKSLDAEVTLFPNPTSGMVRLDVKTAKSGDYLLLVNDAQGRLVKKERIKNEAAFQRHLDLSGLAAGMYSVTVSSKEGSLSTKVIKR